MSLVLASFLLAVAPSPPPDLPPAVYRDRRERVMRELDGCVAVLGARGEMSGVTEDYRLDGNFLWLTGLNEGEAW
ncbi:MAG TPA: aminopeptidase P N-terminal domain-containing protein, partial [Vicinamibacteria bacterium]|nr:aminopeptidase P N-terminal domain-containing protein [Vicinamibacteria bacterium]